MNEVIYSTKEECIKAIETLKCIGLEPLPWMLDQLEKFEKAEKIKKVEYNSDTPIWDTLQAKYPFGKMPKEKKECVENTVNLLLEEGEHAEDPGLLLGKIQCGKTDTFEDIIGLSFDKGIDLAVVLTKGTKALVNQTIMRMKKDFKWFKPSDNLNQRETINIYNIMDIGRTGLKQAKVESGKTVIVCKKEAKNMDRLIDLFKVKSPFLMQKKVLIVDDEADFASRNYQAVKGEALKDKNDLPIAQTSEVTMAKISQQIDDFRKTPQYCRYLQVTATPYCLYLQPQGELNLNGNLVKSFKPRFTSIVPIHDKYIGGKQYFVDSTNPDSMYSHLYHQIDQKCVDVLGHEDKRFLNSSVSSKLIYGLTYALVAYFMATAIRRIQVRSEKNIDYKTSAIIHVDIDKKNHDWQRRIVERLIKSIRDVIVDEDYTDKRIWVAMESIYNDYVESNKKGREEGFINIAIPSLKEIQEEIQNIFSPKFKNYHVQMVNSDEEVDKILDDETGELSLDCAANIFIGGNILDRGVTIKNMLCFFYGRDPKRFQQDTVLQHARMYGARSKEDMAVMRLHTTPYIYKILCRMNELDEQLRQWFIEGKDKSEPNAVFVGYDKEIKPCSSNKIKISNALLLKPGKRILPVGFWTKKKTETRTEMEQIRHLIITSPDYNNQDKDGFFKIDKSRVVDILKLIESTYVYDDKYYNTDRKNDIKELLCALEYCTDKSNGKIWGLHRENRNLNRIRENGGYIDAPDDGRTDTRPSREKAIDAPVIMFIQQNGEPNKDINGENIGWNGAPFYWPVLMTQEKIDPVMYAIEQKVKGLKAVVDNSGILDGIDPKDVLSLTIKCDLEKTYGEEGCEYEYNDCVWMYRALKESTGSRHIQKDENGNWLINSDIDFDHNNDHGIYSLNNEIFPFIVRPYKYICVRNRKDGRADAILLELFEPQKWDIYPLEDSVNEDGDLIDIDTNEILMHTADKIINKNMEEEDFIDNTVTQWIIDYPIKKVLRFRKCNIDWDAVFGNEEE